MERLGDILKRAGPPAPGGRPDAGATPSGAEGTPDSSLCPRCQGCGWLTLDVPADHPRFGEVLPCTCRRQELDREKQWRLEQYSNLGPLAQHTFETMLPKGRSASPENQERFARALDAARAFAASPKGWLVLTGVSGCGKTHLAAAVANYRLSRGQPAFFASVPDLLDHLRSAFSPNREESYDSLFEQVRAAPLLVMDDLGTQSTTPWAREKLFQVLNHRYVAQLATVVTATNLEEMEDRWRSRLSDPNILFGRQTWEVGRREVPMFQQVGGVDLAMLASMTFDNFDTRGLYTGAGDSQAKESLRYAFRAAKEFADAPEGWLVLLGGTGCGKTHLAAAIANYSLRRGQSVFFASVPDLLDHFRSLFSPESRQTYDHIFEEVRRVPLLILDDFGVHTGTPWAQEKLYQLLNYRYTARLPTVITSPLDEDEMEAPFGSRMVDPKVSTVVHIQAPDYRAGRMEQGPTQPRPRGRPVRRT